VNDIIVNGKKISGCAQTRRSGVVLQHGTILVDINIDVMESVLKPPTMKNMNSPRSHKLPITTMRAELGTLPDMKEVKSKLIDSFETEFNIKVVSGTLTDYEQALINKLIREKYENDAWNYKR
jgi:lipoate-protein ligase A